MKIIVNDKMQQGYSYELSEPEGKNFAPDFRPELSPQQILEYGAFEGKYITDCRKEFPADWFENARLSPARADAEKKLLRRKIPPLFAGMATARLDYRTGSARVVSMVLPVLLRAEAAGNRQLTDSQVEGF